MARLPQEVIDLEPESESLSSSEQDELRCRLVEEAKSNLYFLARSILGFDQLVPDFHKPLCRHVEDPRYKRKLFLLPRGTYKTTLITKANSIQQIIRNPEVRILIASATNENAQKILWEIRLKLETNQLLRWLFPDLVPDLAKANRWNNSEILINRQGTYSEATIEAIGVGGTVTSRHYDIQVRDDIINEVIAASPTEMAKAKEWLGYTDGAYVNLKRGVELIIGTRYGVGDPYGDILRDAVPNTSALPDFYGRAFESSGYLCYMRAARENDKLTCPELLDDTALELIKKNRGKRIYSSQYLNYPFTSETKSFDRAWLRYYDYDPDGNVEIRMGDGSKQIVPLSGLYITVRVDPASGESSSTRDRSAVIVDGIDPRGRVFILEAWARKCKWFELFEQMCQMYRRYHPAKVGIETVAMAKVMGTQFREYARKQSLSPYCVELKTAGRAKELRISAYDARFEAGEIFIRPSMHDFVNEYEAFPDPSVPDDLLDAFAYGDQLWIKPVGDAENESWEAEERKLLYFRKRSKTGY